MNHLPIRWRLTIWNTAAVAGLLVAIGVTVYVLFRALLYGQTDRLLESQFAHLQTDPRMKQDPQRRLRYWVREFHEHAGFCCIVFDATGRIFTRTENLPSKRPRRFSQISGV